MLRMILAFLAGALLVTIGFVAQRFTDSPPPSEFASEEAVRAASALRKEMVPHAISLATGDIEEMREILDEVLYTPRIEEARRLYPVREGVLEIEGVYTEWFEPADGVSPENASKVLINLHGGGFTVGARTEGRLESIPVAHLSGLRVVSVDYRQGPEHRFPAASEDVAIVYRQLLKRHAPEQIGIFGCSAGGMLTAQAVAWFDAHDLPRPGAVGILCAGASEFGKGDSAVITEAFGENLGGGELAYFEGADWNDPLVSPAVDRGLLSRFPPTLVITSTRDLALSQAIVTHQRLVDAGAESELHVYEGLGHYFFMDTGLPESRAVFAVMARFFDRHLAR